MHWDAEAVVQAGANREIQDPSMTRSATWLVKARLFSLWRWQRRLRVSRSRRRRNAAKGFIQGPTSHVKFQRWITSRLVEFVTRLFRHGGLNVSFSQAGPDCCSSNIRLYTSGQQTESWGQQIRCFGMSVPKPRRSFRLLTGNYSVFKP